MDDVVILWCGYQLICLEKVDWDSDLVVIKFVFGVVDLCFVVGDDMDVIVYYLWFYFIDLVVGFVVKNGVEGLMMFVYLCDFD